MDGVILHPMPGVRRQSGTVVIIRNDGPRCGPGMREMLGVAARIYGNVLWPKERVND
jgi:dihydroxyacid dehydratase/phosphogluconate dehydratase